MFLFYSPLAFTPIDASPSMFTLVFDLEFARFSSRSVATDECRFWILLLYWRLSGLISKDFRLSLPYILKLILYTS